MIATIICLFVALWLIAFLIAAVADHPWLLLVPLALVGCFVWLASMPEGGNHAPAGQPVYFEDYPEGKHAIATYGLEPVHACFDAVKARNGTEDELWACIKALPPLPDTDWTKLVSVVASIVGLLGAIAATALIVDRLWRRASSECRP